MGRNCITEVLKVSPQRIIKVYSSQKSQRDALYAELLKLQIPIKDVSKQELSQLVKSDSHQSYVAVVKEKEQPSLHAFLEESRKKEAGLVLMLDSIFDPQNLGAIIRAGECYGVDLVVFSKNRGADITPVVSKASAGATELVPILKVSNLVETMKAFQHEGFWAVVSELSERAEPLSTFSFPQKTLLVLGSEGKGVQPLISKKSDFHVSIPMLGNIDSLNVSQAAAVFLNSVRTKC